MAKEYINDNHKVMIDETFSIEQLKKGEIECKTLPINQSLIKEQKGVIRVQVLFIPYD